MIKQQTCFLVTDPDITRGDGIYSRYAPPLDGPSRYALTLSVDAGSAVLALSHNHHLSSAASYSAYKTTGPSVYSETNTRETFYTPNSYTSSSSPTSRNNENQYTEKESYNRDELLPRYTSSESSRTNSRTNQGFVDPSSKYSSFRSSLHSIENQAKEAEFTSFSSGGGQQYPSMGLMQSSEESKNDRPFTDDDRNVRNHVIFDNDDINPISFGKKSLASSEEQDNGMNHHRSRTKTREHDNTRHHRRRSVHDKEVCYYSEYATMH